MNLSSSLIILSTEIAFLYLVFELSTVPKSKSGSENIGVPNQTTTYKHNKPMPAMRIRTPLCLLSNPEIALLASEFISSLGLYLFLPGSTKPL